MKSAQARTILANQMAAIGPRVPGGLYVDSWSNQIYRLVAIGYSLPGQNIWFEVQYDDLPGISTHATSWDKRDRVISQPSD